MAACSSARVTAGSISVALDEEIEELGISSEVDAMRAAAAAAFAASVARRRAEERASASAVSLRMRVVRASRWGFVIGEDVVGAGKGVAEWDGAVRVVVRVVSWVVRWLRVGRIGWASDWSSEEKGMGVLGIPRATSSIVRRSSNAAACARRPGEVFEGGPERVPISWSGTVVLEKGVDSFFDKALPAVGVVESPLPRPDVWRLSNARLNSCTPSSKSSPSSSSSVSSFCSFLFASSSFNSSASLLRRANFRSRLSSSSLKSPNSSVPSSRLRLRRLVVL